MKVRDICSPNPRSCGRDTDLATAARIMGECDCGFVPVVDDKGRIAGALTDRDICLAMARATRPPTQMRAGEIATGTVYTCRPDDPAGSALETMEQHAVRRLPVVNDRNELVGVLSMGDCIQSARENEPEGGCSREAVWRALESVTRPAETVSSPSRPGFKR